MNNTADPESVAETVVLLDGKYRLGQLLGSGAFSWVFEATHAQIDDLTYAVKVLRPEHTGSPDLERRFLNEIRTLAAMKSPYTVRVTDAGKTADGNPYLVMEKLVGVTLRDLVVGEGPLHPLHAARFALDVLRGLESAHNAGVVHRDLKPSNIFIVEEGPDGRAGAKVVDFGIAKILGSSFLREPEHESTVDATPCTPTYAAPEQLHQAPTPRSDLYALGHVLAFALQGEAPYAGTGSFAVIGQHMSAEPVPLSDAVTQSALGELVAKACEKDETNRWASAAEMIEALLPRIDELEFAVPDLPAPHLPARLNFGGSADFTAPDTWSLMSIAGPTREAKREKPVSNLPLETATPQVHVTTAPSRSSALLLIAAIVIAVSALTIALTRGPAESPQPSVTPPVATADTEREATEAEAERPTPAAIAEATRRAGGRVEAAATVPPAHRWTISTRDGGGEATIEYGGQRRTARSLPIENGFGPAVRPVTLYVSLDDGALRETIDDPGTVVMTNLRITRAPAIASEEEDTGPTPGSLSIRRP